MKLVLVDKRFDWSLVAGRWRLISTVCCVLGVTAYRFPFSLAGHVTYTGCTVTTGSDVSGIQR